MTLRPLATAVALVGLTVALLTPSATAASPAPAFPSLADATAEAERLRASLSGLRARSAGSILRLEQAETELGQAVTRSVALDQELDAARAAASGSDGQLRRRVSALYRSGGAVGLWSTLLQAGSPTELVSRKANVDAVVAADVRLRRSAEDGSGRLAALTAAARDSAATSTRATRVAEEQATALTSSMEQQAALLAGATDRVRGLVDQQRREAAAEAARRLAEQQARTLALTAALPDPAVVPAAAGPAGSVVGAYAGPAAACPVGAVHSFTDTWHAPRSGGRKHQGTDVFAPYGSPAYAVVDGVVDRWSDGGLGGIALWLRGDDGTRYYYAHNVANIAVVGQRVVAGEQVAYVGTTGNAATTPPHIHFEAHPGGGPAVNPYAWLAAICAG